ncbi:MAG: 2-amino-3,7-dideoxy-D-threo-hept-6-ulosonate synthase [Candidatus Hydrogenedentota bacterium]
MFFRGGIYMLGKYIRLERIINRETKKTVIVPMDHGVTIGPISGIENMRDMVNEIAEGGANAVLGHLGLPIHGHRKHGKDIGLILHLSGSTIWSPDPNAKVLVNTVENAIKFGADGVSVHINIGALNEDEMLKDLGEVSVKCYEWGIPLLAMMYTRGKKFKSETDPEGIKHAARIAAELGADIVKVSYTGSIKTFEKVVSSCPIPVVIAGGEKIKDEKLIFSIIKDSITAGGKGVAVGRNAFGHESPRKMVRAICTIVHENASVNEAMKILKG